MVVMYLCAGALVALILAAYSNEQDPKENQQTSLEHGHSSVQKPIKRKRIIIAFALTTLFWPLVLLLAVTNESINKSKKITLRTKDLLHPVDIDRTDDLTNKDLTQASQQFVNNGYNSDNIWAFRTHLSKEHRQTVIVEGYALVNSQNEVVDYLVIEEYPEELPALH